MEKEDVLIVKGMQLWATHGHFKEENELGQKFVVDAEVVLDMTDMCLTDDLNKGFSYVSVYNIVSKVVTTEEHKLLQRLAYRICEEINKAYPIKQVRIKVMKPSVAIGGIVDYSAVSIVREPSDFA